ncbi:hypothetical protein FTV88_1535 [Heliorestis convoluta]|uniref:Uncharacterized protein n=1 Tax=Heliorestis convoluta TaxID=356322 RepID=A0A5Q2N4X7_9FIRM|nr:hypothetical protein FTV88_1535 [Heliorestis convoluta]
MDGVELEIAVDRHKATVLYKIRKEQSSHDVWGTALRWLTSL